MRKRSVIENSEKEDAESKNLTFPPRPPIIDKFTSDLSLQDINTTWSYCCLKGLTNITPQTSYKSSTVFYKASRTLLLISDVMSKNRETSEFSLAAALKQLFVFMLVPKE